MGLIVYLLILVLWGLIVGALARLALPGPDPMSIWATIGIGLLGSLIGGVVMRLITGNQNGAGLFVSFVFAFLIMILVRRSRGQGLGSTRRDASGRFP
ncbi:MAG TPA: hypothetical protein VFT50_13220 [Baekduia sp.]|nr:hypothetical protein [Baekduia sp.]